MSKLVSVALVIIMALSLVACAGTGSGGKARVKCPACGYEFDAPVTDH